MFPGVLPDSQYKSLKAVLMCQTTPPYPLSRVHCTSCRSRPPKTWPDNDPVVKVLQNRLHTRHEIPAALVVVADEQIVAEASRLKNIVVDKKGHHDHIVGVALTHNPRTRHEPRLYKTSCCIIMRSTVTGVRRTKAFKTKNNNLLKV